VRYGEWIVRVVCLLTVSAGIETVRADLELPGAGIDVAAVRTIFEAHILLLEGRREKSMEKLIEAAQKIREAPIREATDRITRVQLPDVAAGETSVATDAPSFVAAQAEEVFAEATALAGDDARLRAQVSSAAEADVSEVPVGDRPECAFGRVPAGGTDGWRIRFRPRSWAAVSIEGDADTDLDCTILDQQGDRYKEDESKSSHCLLVWATRYGGDFTVEVSNKDGGISNSYRICANANPTSAPAEPAPGELSAAAEPSAVPNREARPAN